VPDVLLSVAEGKATAEGAAVANAEDLGSALSFTEGGPIAEATARFDDQMTVSVGAALRSEELHATPSFAERGPIPEEAAPCDAPMAMSAGGRLLS